MAIIISGGTSSNTTIPAAIGAYYTSATAGAISSTDTLITYTTSVFDTNSAYSSGVYTIPSTGYYSITAQISISATYATNNNVEINFEVNNTEKVRQQLRAGGAVTVLFPVLSIAAYKFTSGDILKFFVNSTATSPTINNGDTANYFSIIKILGT